MRRQQEHYQNIKMSGLTRAQKIEMMGWMKELMEGFQSLKEDQRSVKETIQSMIEDNRSLKEDFCKKLDEGRQSLEGSFQSLREGVSKKLDECHNSTIEVLDRTIEESRKFEEKLRREREQRERASQKIEDVYKRQKFYF